MEEIGMADTYETGLAIRRQMFGAEVTDKQIADADDFTRDLQNLVTQYCFGEVWGREELPLKLRSLLTVAMLTALGREAELKIHVRGAIANGATKEEIREIFLHAAIYCGIPAAVGGFRSAREVFAELERGRETPDPTRE
jgi:4-carboxymuconolactone decarboxylase